MLNINRKTRKKLRRLHQLFPSTTIREGKYMGAGRTLLSPIPRELYGKKTDEDLKAIYAYLMSNKPIHNLVSQPTPPDKSGEMLARNRILSFKETKLKEALLTSFKGSAFVL